MYLNVLSKTYILKPKRQEEKTIEIATTDVKGISFTKQSLNRQKNVPLISSPTNIRAQAMKLNTSKYVTAENAL